MKLTKADKERAARYRHAVPWFLGVLHERMNYVMQHAQKERTNLSPSLWDALFDLELEVSFHEPAEPPYGRRTT